MNWFQDIFFRRKLTATLAGVRTIALLPVAGGFVGLEMITPPRALSQGSPVPTRTAPGIRVSIGTKDEAGRHAAARSADSEKVHLPALSPSTPVSWDGKA